MDHFFTPVALVVEGYGSSFTRHAQLAHQGHWLERRNEEKEENGVSAVTIRSACNGFKSVANEAKENCAAAPNASGARPSRSARASTRPASDSAAATADGGLLYRYSWVEEVHEDGGKRSQAEASALSVPGAI